MPMHTIELVDGSEYACNQVREGVFSRRSDGTWQQHVGTSDTPRFKTPAALLRWCRANLSYSRSDDGEWPAMKRGSASGWGPGRPVTTGSDSTAPINFRVSAAERAELEAEAKRLGLLGANAAARRRVFPAPA